MTNIEIIKNSYKTWYVFKGKLARKEFWVSFCVNLLSFSLVANIYIFSGTINIGEPEKTAISLVYFLASLFLLIQYFSLTTRRLHDVGKSGWWILLFYIAILGLTNEILLKEIPSAIILILYFLIFSYILYLLSKKSIDEHFSPNKASTLKNLKSIFFSKKYIAISLVLALIVLMVIIYQNFSKTSVNIFVIIGKGLLFIFLGYYSVYLPYKFLISICKRAFKKKEPAYQIFEQQGTRVLLLPDKFYRNSVTEQIFSVEERFKLIKLFKKKGAVYKNYSTDENEPIFDAHFLHMGEKFFSEENDLNEIAGYVREFEFFKTKV